MHKICSYSYLGIKQLSKVLYFSITAKDLSKKVVNLGIKNQILGCDSQEKDVIKEQSIYNSGFFYF